MALAERDPELGRLIPRESAQLAAEQSTDSLAQLIATLLRVYEERPALGQRAYELIRDPATGRTARRHLPRFETISYGQLRARVEALSCAWRHHDQAPVRTGEFVCLLGFTGIDYVVADLACVYTRAVAVPLQPTMAPDDLAAIMAETAPAAIVASVAHLELAVSLAVADGRVRSIAVMDYDDGDDDDRDRLALARQQVAGSGPGPAVLSLADLVAFGHERQWTPAEPRCCDPARMGSLIYTSGSTGTPKGAIYSEGLMREPWTPASPLPTVTLGYTPMSHTHARKGLARTLLKGGTIYFTLKSDMSTLFEDIRLVRPTTLALIPRVAEAVYHHFHAEVARRAAADARGAATVRSQVIDELRSSYLGDRLISATLLTAPTPQEVRDFLCECFGIDIDETYGMTETGGTVCIGDRIHRASVIDYRLRDVPELGYFTSDQPFPRGELLVKTRTAISGYFNRPEATAALFDAEGYIATGDIVQELGPDHIVWVDRRNTTLKLSQGEYVPIGALEARFESGIDLIGQIYLYGNSRRPYLLAVVVPDFAAARVRLGPEPDVGDLHDLVLDALQEAKGRLGLRSHEIPRDVIVETEPFTPENGLLSGVRKLLRQNLMRRYGDRLEALYRELDARQRRELTALKQDSAGSTLEKVAHALSATIGVPDLELSTTRTFDDLGGDSLSAVGLSALLEDIFAVPVPVSTITAPGATPLRLASFIDDAVSAGDVALATFGRVHGHAASIVSAGDLKLENFFDTSLAGPARTGPMRRDVTTVLITGANGYLGRFLTLEWMSRLAERDGRVICVLRAESVAAARRRLEAELVGADPELSSRFQSLAANHLEFVAGDITAPWLGLPQAQYARLAESADLVVHAAALVNHMLPYQHLFGPNVAGTAELIKLALTGKRKRFDYVSSVAVSRLNGGTALHDENADVRDVAAVPLTGAYINGYVTSKWAAEVLLRESHEKFGLPVNIYRSDMILAHRRYAAQLNVSDTFTRLLYSIVRTGLAPASFYEPAADGGRARAHYDGLPVDFTAAVMARLGDRRDGGYRTVNVVNPHDDGRSLDTFVDSIAAVGYPVHRIAGYEEWLQRFEGALRALPETARARSSLAILESLRRPRPARPDRTASAQFEAALRELGDDLHVPHLDEPFIQKYLEDLRTLGFIPPPPAAR